MQIEVIKNGNTASAHTADFAVEIASEGSVMIQLKEGNRKLSAIAEDFEDADEIRTDAGGSWSGYGDVFVLFRVDPATVQVRIRET